VHGGIGALQAESVWQKFGGMTEINGPSTSRCSEATRRAHQDDAIRKSSKHPVRWWATLDLARSGPLAGASCFGSSNTGQPWAKKSPRTEGLP